MDIQQNLPKDEFRRFTDFADIMPAPVLLLDKSQIFYANPIALQELSPEFGQPPFQINDIFRESIINKIHSFIDSESTAAEVYNHCDMCHELYIDCRINISKTPRLGEGIVQAAIIADKDYIDTLAKSLNSFEDIFLILDENLNIISVYTNMFGRTDLKKEDMIGKKLHEFFDLEDPDIHTDAMEKALRGQNVTFEWSHKLSNRRKYLQTKFAPVYKNNKVIGVSGLCRDISRYKILENELQEKLDIYHSFVRYSTDGVVIIESTGVIIEWNEGAEKIFGINASDALGKYLWDVQYRVALPEERDIGAYNMLRHQILSMINGKSPETDNTLTEREIANPDGQRKFVQSRIFRLKNSQGIMLASINRDITKNIVIQDELRHSEEKYKELIKNLNEGIWVIDDEGVTTYCNDVMARMLGYSPEEMLGTHFFDYMPSDYIEMAKEKFKSRRHGKREGHEFVFLHKNGAPVNVFMGTSPLTDDEGNFRGAMAGVLDITDKKITAEQLEQSQREIEIHNKLAKVLLLQDSRDVKKIILDIILESVGSEMGVFGFFNTKGKLQIAETNYDADNNITTEYHTLSVSEIPDLWKDTLFKKKSILSNKPSAQQEPDNHTGQYITPLVVHGISIGLIIIYDKMDKFNYEMRILLDGISEFLAPVLDTFVKRLEQENKRIKAEEELSKLNAELEEKISIRTSELERTKSELMHSLDKEIEINRMKNKFISNITHEYRTPLTIVQSSAQLIQRLLKKEKLTVENAQKYLDKIISSAHRLNDLVDEVLIIGRSETDRMKFEPTNFSFDDLIYEVIDEAAITCKNDADMHYQEKDNTGLITTDRSLLRHILMNILLNSCLYSPSGSKVDVMAEKSGKYLIIDIADNGSGIPKDEREHIFEPFFRGANAENTPGVGLGLTIVQKCAERLNADIFIESEENIGTKFSVSLPIE